MTRTIENRQLTRKRIVYVEGNTDGTVGGSFFSLLFLVKNLDHSHYAPTVVFSTPNPLIPKYEAAGASVIVRPTVRPLRATQKLLRAFARIANAVLWLAVEPVRLARFLRRNRFDLVHLNNSVERNHPWMLAAVLAAVPCVTHERGINQRLSREAGWLARRLSAIICISSAVRHNLERLGLSDCDLVTIPNGLDPADLPVRKGREAVLAEFGIPPNARLIGLVGNIRAWKGQEVVLHAMEIVARSHPDVVCLLIGHYSDVDLAYKHLVEQTIIDRRLERNVVVTGYRANVPDYVAALEILIHASILPEPFGRVLLEGMALRKPLVASRGGAVPEIVDDGVTGLLFQPGDAEDLAAKLMILLESAEQARLMGEAGYERLRTQFDIKTNAQKTMAVYQRLL
jgi:glycosyltransferase involved in cell wall biosynthesis